MSLVTLLIVLATFVTAVILRPGLAFTSPLLLEGLDQLSATAHPVFAMNPALMNFVVAAFVGWGVAYRIARGRNMTASVSTVWILVILLYVYAWITLIWAPAMPSFVDTSDNTAFVANRLAKYFPYFILYVALGPLLLAQVSELRAPLQFFLLMSGLVLVGLVVFGEFSEHRGLVVAGGEGGTARLPLASFSGTVILAAIFVRSGTFQKVFSILRPAVIVLALIAIVGTGARGALFTALLVALIVWPLSQEQGVKGRYPQAVLLLLVLLLGVWIAFEIAGEVQGGRWRLGSEADAGVTQYSIYGRFAAQLQMIKDVFVVWQSSPSSIIFGVGNSASFALLPHHFYPHNVPLEVLAEEGLVGFSVYCAALVLAYRSFRRLLDKFRGDSSAVGDICFLFSVGFFYFLLSMKEGSFASVAHLTFFPAIVLANLDVRVSKRRLEHVQGASVTRLG